MRKFTVGFVSGVVVVLAVQSRPMAPIRENVTDYVITHTTSFMDDFVDTYIQERDKLIKKNEDKS